MTFPVAELKFSNILRSETGTSCLVRLYRVDDGGIVNGQQVYLRTLKRSTTVFTVRNPTDQQIVNFARNYLINWAFEEFGVTLPPDRVICSL